MSSTEQLIRGFQRDITATLFVKYAGAWLAGAVGLWGSLVLVMRLATSWPLGHAAWGALTIPVAVAAAAFLAWRGTPSPAAARAWLDRFNRAGGLLMAETEARMEGWQPPAETLRTPEVNWQGGRTGILLLTAMAFLAGAWLIPQRMVQRMNPPALQIGGDVDRLNAQIALLRQAHIVDALQANNWQAQVRQTESDARGNEPAKTWEALDHLEQELGRTAATAAEKAVQKSHDLDQEMAVAKALSLMDPARDRQALASAMGELAKLADKAQAQRQAMDPDIPPELLQRLAQGALDSQELRKLVGDLSQEQAGVQGLLESLRDAKLIDGQSLQQLMQGQPKLGDPAALAAALQLAGGQNTQGRDPADIMQQWIKGGWSTDEGPGSPPLGPRQPTTPEGAKFKEQVLPPAALDSLKNSRITDVTRSAPTVETSGGASEPGALNQAAAGGGAAVTHEVLPEQNGTVKRYFSRQAAGHD